MERQFGGFRDSLFRELPTLYRVGIEGSLYSGISHTHTHSLVGEANEMQTRCLTYENFCHCIPGPRHDKGVKGVLEIDITRNSGVGVALTLQGLLCSKNGARGNFPDMIRPHA